MPKIKPFKRQDVKQINLNRVFKKYLSEWINQAIKNTNFSYYNKQPSDKSIDYFLDEQFYIYEIDSNLKILQKIKIPKDVFKDFVEKFSRWEFYPLIAF